VLTIGGLLFPFFPTPLKLNTLPTAAPPDEVLMLPMPRELTRPPGALVPDEGLGGETTVLVGGAGERDGATGVVGEVLDWLDNRLCAGTGGRPAVA
jgi:hypothetical protein